MNITLIPVGKLADVVPHVLPFIRESEQWARGRVTADDLLRFALTGAMQLWAVHEEGVVHGHVMTEIKQYPQCKMLTIQYCAMVPGSLEQIEDEMQHVAAQFAADAGCAGIEFVGRPGWRDTAKKYGYEVQSVMYQKFFEVAK
jgi:hypothetical protein